MLKYQAHMHACTTYIFRGIFASLIKYQQILFTLILMRVKNEYSRRKVRNWSEELVNDKNLKKMRAHLVKIFEYSGRKINFGV